MRGLAKVNDFNGIVISSQQDSTSKLNEEDIPSKVENDLHNITASFGRCKSSNNDKKPFREDDNDLRHQYKDCNRKGNFNENQRYLGSAHQMLDTPNGSNTERVKPNVDFMEFTLSKFPCEVFNSEQRTYRNCVYNIFAQYFRSEGESPEFNSEESEKQQLNESIQRGRISQLSKADFGKAIKERDQQYI